MRQTTLAIKRAYIAWKALHERRIDPDGHFDSKSRWEPSEQERCSCCDRIRPPSVQFPYSRLKHCRSVEHVANKFQIPATLLRKRIAQDRAPTVHPDHFKLVAVRDGRYFSIFDGTTEYVLGQTLRQPAKPNHGGGFYCYPDVQDLLYTAPEYLYPTDSVLADAPKVILRLRVAGPKVTYPRGKVAFSEVTPIEVVNG